MEDSNNNTFLKKGNDHFLLFFAQFILGGMAVIYFLGQIYFSSINPINIIIALMGLIVAALGGKKSNTNIKVSKIVVICSFLGLFGIMYNIYQYYSVSHTPGNNYPLISSILFIFAFIVVIYFRVKSKNA